MPIYVDQGRHCRSLNFFENLLTVCEIVKHLGFVVSALLYFQLHVSNKSSDLNSYLTMRNWWFAGNL